MPPKKDPPKDPNKDPTKDADKETEVISPGEGGNGPYRGKTPGTEVIQARTPDPITSRQQGRRKPRTVEDIANPHTPSRVHRYRGINSPTNSIGAVRGLFVPWSREVDYGKSVLPNQFPLQRLAPMSPGNQTLATRTLTREFDFYAPPVWEKRNALKDRYPYDPPVNMHSGHNPYFSYPPGDWRNRVSHTEPILPPPRRKLVPEGKWSVASNKGTGNPHPPRRKVVTDPGKVQTALWIQQHSDPTQPAIWPHKIRHDPELDRDFLETPLGKRRYIGHVPRVTDRDRWDRQYDDYLLYNDVDSDYHDRKRNPAYYNSDPAFRETSHWIRKSHGVRPDYTDHHNWFQREKEILRQRERERYLGEPRDHLITRGSIIAMEGSDLGPDWYMSENERLRYLRDRDLARWRTLKERRRYREDDSDFTSVSQRAAKKDMFRRGIWTPLNAPDEPIVYDYKPNWRINDNWRYKKPRRNHRYPEVGRWLEDR